MKIMVLTPYLPHAGVGHGGGTAVRGLVTWLARRHEVVLCSLVRPGEADHVPEVEALGLGVVALPFLDRGARGADRFRLAGRRLSARMRAWSSGFPYFVEKYHQADLTRLILAEAGRFAPDAVQVEYLQLAPYVRDLRRHRARRGSAGPRLVLNTHELGSIPRERRAVSAETWLARAQAGREAAAWRRLQVAATGWADRTLCVTEEDRRACSDQGGLNLETVPLGMDLSEIKGGWTPPPEDRFLFVGSRDHAPNRRAVDLLLDRIWPEIRAQRPGAELVIAGRGFDDHVAGRGVPEGVTVPGFVPDLGPLFRDSSLFLAPLPDGGGIKIKILEAMARGIPVVTTPVGAEGIAAPGDGTCWIAAAPDEFTAAVLYAASDRDEAVRRGAAGRRLVEKKFSWESITARLSEIYAGG